MTPQASNGSTPSFNTKRKVLVAGPSGLIGVAAIEAFLSAGWEVVGISRAQVDAAKGAFEFISLDLRDRPAAHEALSRLPASRTSPTRPFMKKRPGPRQRLVACRQIAVNNRMLHNVVEPLVSAKPALTHVSILQGTKAYGAHLHPIAIPARESDPRDDHRDFFFDQQDYVRDMGAKHGFTYTALRPQLVTAKRPGL